MGCWKLMALKREVLDAVTGEGGGGGSGFGRREQEEILVSAASWIWVGCPQWMGAVLDLPAALCGEERPLPCHQGLWLET